MPSQKEKPSHILPDLVVLYEKDDQGNFVQTRDTRFFAGYRSYYSTEQNVQLQTKGKGISRKHQIGGSFLTIQSKGQRTDHRYSTGIRFWSSGAELRKRGLSTFLRKVERSSLETD